MPSPSYSRQIRARKKLLELTASPRSTYTIHYACQSFYQGGTAPSPRIGAIAARNLATGTTETFSFHREHEQWANSPPRLHDPNDELEFRLLSRFFQFLKENRNANFVHWNMRDSKFGFAALEHRYQILGGTPFELHDQARSDLAVLLTDCYGDDYVPPPQMLELAKANILPLAGFMDGKQESQAFDAGHFYAVTQSTLAKVSILASFLTRAAEGRLITNAGWWTLYGGPVRGAMEMARDNPMRSVVGALLAILGGIGFLYRGWFS